MSAFSDSDIDAMIGRLSTAAVGKKTARSITIMLRSLRDERRGLKAAIEKQGKAAIAGMDAATNISHAQLESAKRLRAESAPDVLDSERAANAALTEEVDALRDERDALAEDAARLKYLEDTGLNLVNDDGGRWAVSDTGLQPVRPTGGFTDTVDILCSVYPDNWKDSIREAIDYTIQQGAAPEGEG